MARSNKDFWDKVLVASKVRRILEKQGIDPEGFKSEYEADTTRPRKSIPEPSEGEIEAVETFLETNDYATFLTALGAKTRVKADSTLRRVLTWKGREPDEVLMEA